MGMLMSEKKKQPSSLDKVRTVGQLYAGKLQQLRRKLQNCPMSLGGRFGNSWSEIHSRLISKELLSPTSKNIGDSHQKGP